MALYTPTPLPGASTGPSVSTAPGAAQSSTADPTQQATPSYLQQQQGGGVGGGMANMVKALMAGYKQNPYLNKQAAPTWPPAGTGNPVPYVGSGPYNTSASPTSAGFDPNAAGAAGGTAPPAAAGAGMLQPPPNWLQTLAQGGQTAPVDPMQAANSYMSGT